MKILFQTLIMALMFSHVEASEEATKKSIDPHKTKEQFEKIITRVTDLYTPTIKDLGHDFKLTMDWDDDEENAHASQPQDSNTWELKLPGGYYKADKMTDDAYALVVCHELGHLLAGAPFYPGTKLSVEGQADFWATSVCLKKYFNTYPEKASRLSLSMKENCDRVYTDEQSRNTCYLVAKASLSLSKDFNNKTHEPDIDLPDNNIINSTSYMHPDAQCRLDTYIAGSLCAPQETSLSFQKKLLSENLMSDSLCMVNLEYKTIKVEQRPKCWFKENSYEIINSDYEKEVGTNYSERITIYYANYIPGEYTITVVPDEEASKYVSVETYPTWQLEDNKATGKDQEKFSYNEHEYRMKFGDFGEPQIMRFKYKFKKRLLSKKLNFYLLVKRDGKVISSRDYKMEVNAKLWMIN
ncbi:hypothetical protein SHI21_20610 [Bacteriovorax sp. PP10]|uniref:Peptidase M48 domain-containing protein n=1 Tax=Bacteriovorax antarcticus TaxID=3088717 RepID=A0ABU5W1F8_9BACT|nr:hypothetical protein [Bacteriovorax sp. PP10]MEA9358652.1 hypothetical protein [Bacteriovorax sp. PP10]